MGVACMSASWPGIDQVMKKRLKIRVDCGVPSLASSKQCLGSQWLVKMMTLWPLFCKPTAASTTNLSAPPIPRSGWKKTIVFLLLLCSAILPTRWGRSTGLHLPNGCLLAGGTNKEVFSRGPRRKLKQCSTKSQWSPAWLASHARMRA